MVEQVNRGIRIETRIKSDLTLGLFDVNTGNELRSFPKKGVEADKLAAAETQFKKMQMYTRDRVRKQLEAIKCCYLQNQRIPFKEWYETYMTDALNRRIAALIVWKHTAEQNSRLYTVMDDGYADSNGMPVSLSGGDVKVAGPMEMSETENRDWQRYFTDRKLRQPYAQVWEPVIPWKNETICKKYDGIRITTKQRNSLRSILKNAGISMKSDEMQKKYDHRSGRYEFNNQSTIAFGHCFRLDYTVSENNGELIFGQGVPLVNPGNREMNKVLFELDRMIINHCVSTDDDAGMLSVGLEPFTAAQISEWQNIAINKKSSRCTAFLLNYKQEHFAQYESVEEFTLD